MKTRGEQKEEETGVKKQGSSVIVPGTSNRAHNRAGMASSGQRVHTPGSALLYFTLLNGEGGLKVRAT